MIRLAAVADVHFGSDSAGMLRPHLEHLPERADVLLVAGDLTRSGDPGEASILAEEIAGLPLPKIAVLGNHDYHHDQQRAIADALRSAGAIVLEREAVTLEVVGVRVGVAGVKGFGGGFAGACATEFGEPEMKGFVSHTRSIAESLEQSLSSLDADLRVALMHYSPIEGTLQGERLEIYPFLGSYLLGEAVDRAGADLVLHGHAHSGSQKGVTPGGIHVRNVALPLIKRPYNVYCLGPSTDADCEVVSRR